MSPPVFLCRLLALTLWIQCGTSLLAHQVGESYLLLHVLEDHLEGEVHTLVADLDEKLALDASGDGKVTEEELVAKIEAAKAYIQENVRISANGQPLTLNFGEHSMLKVSLGQYVRFHFRTPTMAEVPDVLDISHTVFFDSDANQRGRVILESNAKTGETNTIERVALVFEPGDGPKSLDLTVKYSPVRELGRFIWEGMWHIWIGLDHILFLAALLLPAVLILSGGRWEPIGNFRTALWNVVKIVTCFTFAHSITLSLSALGVMTLSSRVVESIIALSVFLAALNNIFPLIKQQEWVIVFLFGLFHGFGFASVFGDLLSGTALTIPLVGFNIGVEIGQIGIILVLFPLLYVLSKKRDFYVKVILYAGSAIIAVRAAIWFVERAFPSAA